MYKEKLLKHIGGAEHRHLLLALEEMEVDKKYAIKSNGMLIQAGGFGEKNVNYTIHCDLTTNLQDIPEKDAETLCQLLNIE